MSKQTKTLVHKLRFPEFQSSEEWKDEQLSNVGEIITGKTPDTSDESLWNGDIQFVTPTDMSEEKYQWKTQRTIVKNSNTKTLPIGSTMFTCIASIGKMSLSVNPCITNQQINSVIPFKNYSNEFVYYSLLGIVPKIKGTQANTTLPIINKTEFSKFTIGIPPTKVEQQKIADCLSYIDELVTAQTQKIAALKDHKKGMMQQLFPAEGETVPKLRFPEFENDGEWEQTTIGNIGSFYYGKSAPKWSLEEKALTPCVRYGELYTKFGAAITETYSRTNIDPSNLRFSKGGEILVPRVGEKPEDFGKCCCYLPLGNIAIGEMISVFETAQKPLFYTYYFRHMYRQFAKVVEGQNVKNLYYTELEPLQIFRPSLPEQQKIADCLSSIDELIAGQIIKLESYKTHKKGMLQQLFPSADEVTE